MKRIPIVWSIAGSDSGGGAGIQADVKTLHGMGCHPCTVITAVTAQNTMGVPRILALDAVDVRAQCEALALDLPPAAVKIGMVPSRESAAAIREALSALDCPVVLDPVLVASSGASLSADPRGEPVWTLATIADLVCPNLHEASALLGHDVHGPEGIQRAALELLERGCRAVVIKGGHGDGPLAMDYLHDGERGMWISNHRIGTGNTHGTGCTQSSAIAAALASGVDRLADAVVVGRMMVNAAIRESLDIGGGPGPVRQGNWPQQPQDLPWLTATPGEALSRPRFPSPGDTPLGLYPCVEAAVWIDRLAALGVTTIQLRNKNLRGESLRREVSDAIDRARRLSVRLFVNDYWELAVELGAYGVHLGQEDLDGADIPRILAAGLRLGISTHCYSEVARAHALRPSYIACGPIWETTIKAMAFAPQGIDMLECWRRTLAGYPLVAIGGIDAVRAVEAARTGVDGISVIRAISDATDYRAAAFELMARMEQGRAEAPLDADRCISEPM